MSKFHSEKDIFITCVDEISANDLLSYMIPKLSRENLAFPQNTIFYIIGGIHSHSDGTLGRSDPTLMGNFYFQFFDSLINVCGMSNCKECRKPRIQSHGTSVWKEMKYVHKAINLFSKPNIRMDDYKASEASYELSEVSINDLKQLALEIRTGTQPLVLIHAYCFSKYNVVNQILTKYGAMVRISLSSMTNSRSIPALDSTQESIIEDFIEVSFTNQKSNSQTFKSIFLDARSKM